MTNMLGPNGTPNSGSNDESGLVKYGVKHFKHVSGALCTISQHHEGGRESKVTLFYKVSHPISDGHPYPNYCQHHHLHYLPHPQHPHRPDHNHSQHRPNYDPHEGENWRVEGNDLLRR